MSKENNLSFEDFTKEVLSDYKIAVTSRECSLLGRREVLTGKAKFGIFGDGKEVPQLAWAKSFKAGDWRSGYYRDQTFMMAIGELTPVEFFAGLYGHVNADLEPMSAGRQMGGHFSTATLNPDGSWKNLTETKNSSSDISPTAGQMPRLLGLAQASKIYRNEKSVQNATNFSNKGNEIAWGTIGNASTSEGLFWETINAAGVLQVPMVMNVWDDEYGISVHAKHQTTKENISEVLSGFQRNDKGDGYEILKVKAWDYPSLIETYQEAEKIAREEHVPVLIHVLEVTQPQGHSTSGSHERYKSKERLEWEKEFDCNLKMREFIINSEFATEEELKALEKEIKIEVRDAKNEAWKNYTQEILAEKEEFLSVLKDFTQNAEINALYTKLEADRTPIRKDIASTARAALRIATLQNVEGRIALAKWIEYYIKNTQPKYSSNLHSNYKSALDVAEVLPTYDENPESVDARIVIRDNFDAIFDKHPEVLIFGEDAGKIGDVNQGLEGMQEKYGELRVSDTGIREATILGQGIGMAMRGLRPIAEIQYLDYILYALQIMSDDLATVQYRTKGKQKAPLIVRTRGHRLEGIWHSGSPMGGLLHLLRGIYILTPRNMTKAAGFYNTLLESDEPGLIIENLNGYRLKEDLPSNLGEFKTPIGVVETIKEGTDITILSYGSTLKIVEEAAAELEKYNISVEVIDAQSLLPFDINAATVESLKKTNRFLVVDEDVPGGASAYLMQEVLEKQGGYRYLDSKPSTLTAKAHRPAYGTDGDYFSKPSMDDIFEKVYAIMHESNPTAYPELY